MVSSEEPIPQWELDDGVPQITDPFIQQYLAGRADLIDQEKSSRADASFRASLTPMAHEACSIVSRIRANERGTVWSADSERDGRVFPGMPYRLARERMESSDLWKIVRKMPKGALLHAHFDATIDTAWLVDQALGTEGMGFMSSEPLSSAAALASADVQFRYVGPTLKESSASIYTSDYVANTYIPVTHAASTFSGGVSAFNHWLKTRMTVTASEALDHHHGIDDIWRKFGSTFTIIGSILIYEPIFRCAIQKLFTELLADGIRWVDLRCAFVKPLHRTAQPDLDESFHSFFAVFGDELAKFQAANPGFWGARFIWTTLRIYPKEGIVAHMKKCLDMKTAFPDLISGFDLVGQEDLGRPLADLVPELFWFRKRCTELGVEIPFFFHAGETLGDGDGADLNLFDAVLLGTRRLGHAFSLYKHPLLIQMVRAKHILVEACPISNEVLRLTGSILQHPLPALLARGVAVALCNDDPANLGHGANGLTGDFWSALQGWENLGLAGLGSLAENSVRWAAFEPDISAKAWASEVRKGATGDGVRGERMRLWRGEWELFCEWVVREFAADYGSDGEE
jgi:adenosine deaminase CECR1